MRWLVLREWQLHAALRRPLPRGVPDRPGRGGGDVREGAWTDPDGYENVNIVATAAKPLISALSAQLRAAFAIV